ncbi:hypothetical protein LEP3755_53650 [Leptolyngbya sp. NIES-3755]|nr:hypothetical protein LEP3755_53650 [Leptolyngbya sp. NIES-3755]
MQQDFSTSEPLSSADLKAVDRLWTVLAELQIVHPPEVEKPIEDQPIRWQDPTVLPPPIAIAPIPPKITPDPSRAVEAFEQLQAVLIDPKLAPIKQELDQLMAQIHQSDQLIELLLPLVTKLLERKISESQEEIAQAIAPTMGKAIQKQIEIEQDSIVDALYPIIGGTISKYLAETVRAINDQIENTLSVQGIKRKITARIKGVSEAELILKEAMPLKMQAVFLIHKASGLVLSEIQGSGDQQLDSDMVAGMLTAIRSFANDCIAQVGQSSELNEIDYGRSKIVLEVAGYCYLAIVIQGEPTQQFLDQVRQVLRTLVQHEGTTIAAFEGDYDELPQTIPTTLQTLLEQNTIQKANKPPIAIIVALIAIAVPIGISWYHEHLRERVQTAIDKTPELAIYDLEPEVRFGQVKLLGRLPNEPLRAKAAQITKETLPNWSIDNDITVVDVPADPMLAAAEVQRITKLLNQSPDINIVVNYQSEQVTIEGTVLQANEIKRITQAYRRIPGVKTVQSALQVRSIRKEFRLYFAIDSIQLERSRTDLAKLRSFLQQYPQRTFRIVGYSNDLRLARSRAQTVQKMLVQQGVPFNRIEMSASDQFDSIEPEWRHRSAIVEVK